MASQIQRVRHGWTKKAVALGAAALTAAGTFGAMAPTAAAASSVSWTSTSGTSAPTQYAGLAYDDATQTAVMFGGTTGTSTTGDDSSTTFSLATVSDTWLWNGTAWSQANPATSPSARFGSSAAYDAASGQLLLFGGGNESISIDSDSNVSTSFSVQSDTWSWSGSTWSQLHPASSPPGRVAAAAAYDPAHKQIVLFGGVDSGTSSLGDTWVWNGTTWTQLHPATSPPARSDASLAYDATTKRLILFGGLDSDQVPLGDTWAWDGTNWTQLSPAQSPSARADHAMASDPAVGGVVLYGGVDVDSDSLSDTWLWNGSGWTALSATGSPGPLDSAAMAYDAQTTQLVLVGGEDDNGDVSPSTWLLAGPGGVSTIDRVWGNDRIATANAIADKEFAAGTANAVVLARSDAFPDALAGGPLAAHVGGPLLLSGTAKLDVNTKAEIQKLLPSGGMVYLLGGTAGLSTDIDAALKGLGYQTKRIAGNDRFETAVAVADALGDPATVFEASGLNFPDALAGVPAAISTVGAILLTNGSAQSTATKNYLAAHPPAKKYALGGPAAAADPGATALVGTDRYATAAAVASTFFPAPATVGVATGANYPDALAAGVLLGAKGAPLLLAPSTGALPSSVSNYLTAKKAGITAAYAFGGTASLSADMLTAVQKAIGS